MTSGDQPTSDVVRCLACASREASRAPSRRDLHHEDGQRRVAGVEQELPGRQRHRERRREQGGRNRAHGWPSRQDDQEADRNKRQQVEEGKHPLSPVHGRERLYVVRKIQVTRRDQQRARTDVIDGIPQCADPREADPPLPRAAPVDLIAEHDLPWAPDPGGIVREVLGQPGSVVNFDAESAALQDHRHTVPPLRLENPVDDERRVTIDI